MANRTSVGSIRLSYTLQLIMFYLNQLHKSFWQPVTYELYGAPTRKDVLPIISTKLDPEQAQVIKTSSHLHYAIFWKLTRNSGTVDRSCNHAMSVEILTTTEQLYKKTFKKACSRQVNRCDKYSYLTQPVNFNSLPEPTCTAITPPIANDWLLPLMWYLTFSWTKNAYQDVNMLILFVWNIHFVVVSCLTRFSRWL